MYFLSLGVKGLKTRDIRELSPALWPLGHAAPYSLDPNQSRINPGTWGRIHPPLP